MDILVKAAQFILSLSLLIIIHELGHFLFAKFFKCRVEKFYLFFNPGFTLFKYKKGETEYGLGWLPLGGYVKISGMIDESMDKEQMKQPMQPYEFRAKKPYQRLLIMVGGVLMNFILALIIYIGVLYAWGEVGREIGFMNGDKILTVDNQEIEDFHNILPTIVLNKAQKVQVERQGEVIDIYLNDDDIAKLLRSKRVIGLRYPFKVEVTALSSGSPSAEAGMKVGDNIIKVNQKEFIYFDEFSEELKENRGTNVQVTVMRNTELIDLNVKLSDEGMLGISFNNNFTDFFEIETLNYGFLESVPAGIAKGWETSTDYLKQFKLIFNRKTKGYESLGGFITIGNIFPGIWNWKVFWNMTAFLSIILGIMNILPIPALDGGHVMFVLYEMISGRKPNEKFLEYAQYVGLSLLLLLVLYANANDVIKLFK